MEIRAITTKMRYCDEHFFTLAHGFTATFLVPSAILWYISIIDMTLFNQGTFYKALEDFSLIFLLSPQKHAVLL